MKYWNTAIVCICVYYVIVAHHFGVGILDLPIDVAAGGFGPFILVYGVVVFMEIVLLILGIQAFHNTRQRVIERMLIDKANNDFVVITHDDIDGSDSARIPLINGREGISATDEDEEEEENSDMNQRIILFQDIPGDTRVADIPEDEVERNEEESGGFVGKKMFNEEEHPQQHTKGKVNIKKFDEMEKSEIPYVDINMHILTQEHFNKYISYFVDLSLIFALIPISKAIATVQTFLLMFTSESQLIESLSPYFIPLFLIISTIAILIFVDMMAFLIAFITNFNILFIGTIITLGAVVYFEMDGMGKIPAHYHDWNNILSPVFTSKIAVSENCYVIPFIFSRLLPYRKQTGWFLATSVFAVLTSSVLCFIWVLEVLLIVPQGGGGPSLEGAKESGDLSPVPFSQVVVQSFPSISWITGVMNVFIFFTILITYIVDFVASRHIFFAYFNSFSVTGIGRRCAQITLCPKFIFGVFFFWVYVIGACLVCLVFIQNIDFLLELVDSTMGIVADLVIVWIIISEAFIKPPVLSNGMAVSFLSKNLTRFLSGVLLTYTVGLLGYNIIHIIVRLVQENRAAVVV